MNTDHASRRRVSPRDLGEWFLSSVSACLLGLIDALTLFARLRYSETVKPTAPPLSLLGASQRSTLAKIRIASLPGCRYAIPGWSVEPYPHSVSHDACIKQVIAGHCVTTTIIRIKRHQVQDASCQLVRRGRWLRSFPPSAANCALWSGLRADVETS